MYIIIAYIEASNQETEKKGFRSQKITMAVLDQDDHDEGVRSNGSRWNIYDRGQN